MKNILIDFTQIPKNKTGVGVYAVNTFKYLNDNFNKYLFLIQKDDKELFNLLKNLDVNKNIIRINSFFFRNILLRIIFEQLAMPFIFLLYRINISHSLHYTFPIISFYTKIYVTIHDLTFLLYPEYHTRFKILYFKLFLKYFVYLPHKYICVSNSTKNDFQNITNINEVKLSTIPLGVEPDLIKKYNLIHTTRHFNFNYLLYIGTIEPRKNIPNLIKAYNLFKNNQKEVKLVIVGGFGWHYNEILNLINALNLNNDVIFTGFVSDELKYRILKDASVFIYPSFYEGFGLPILESIQFNIPTICSKNSSLIEVGGDCVSFINPYDYIDIYNKINFIYKAKIDSKQILKNINHLSLFNWQNTLKQTLKLYND